MIDCIWIVAMKQGKKVDKLPLTLGDAIKYVEKDFKVQKLIFCSQKSSKVQKFKVQKLHHTPRVRKECTQRSLVLLCRKQW